MADQKIILAAPKPPVFRVIRKICEAGHADLGGGGHYFWQSFTSAVRIPETHFTITFNIILQLMSPSPNQLRTYVSYIVTECKYTLPFFLLHKISLPVHCDSEGTRDTSFRVLGRPVRRQDIFASLSTNKIPSTKWIQIYNPSRNLPALKTVRKAIGNGRLSSNSHNGHVNCCTQPNATDGAHWQRTHL